MSHERDCPVPGLQSFLLYHVWPPDPALVLFLQVAHFCSGFAFNHPEMPALPSSFDLCAVSMALVCTPGSSNITHKGDLHS